MSTDNVPVRKYHGTGNDFVVVDAGERVPNRRAFADVHCDRTTGLHRDGTDRTGADGVLFLHLEDRFSPPRVIMTLVQPDGSVAAMCGNGARCAAAWAASETGSDEVMIDTQAGTRHATVTDDWVEIEMGVPSFDPVDVPALADEPLIDAEIEGWTVTAVDTGVPHAVVFVDDIDAVDVEGEAPALRHADVFPEGANVTFAARDGDGFRQRTFERGVEGETRSCGTGAVAVAAVAKRRGLIGDEEVRVSPPGGDLHVRVPDAGDASLRGPVEHEFDCTVPARPAPEPEP